MSITLGGTSPAVTFPDATVQDTSAIVGGKVPYTNLPAGSVLQVVQGSINATATSASSTYANTGLTATITPKFSTSKILVLLTLQGVGKDTGNTSVNLRIQRAASTIITFTNSFTGGNKIKLFFNRRLFSFRLSRFASSLCSFD